MGDSSMYNRPQGWAPTEKSSSERGADCPILLYLVEIMENKKKLTCSVYKVWNTYIISAINDRV